MSRLPVTISAAARLSDARRTVVVLRWAAIASLGVWAVVMTAFMLDTPAGDYAVYRGLSPAVLDGRALYEMRLGPLAFTYPAFAALPLSLLGKVGFTSGLATLTAVSCAALARTAYVLARAVLRERPRTTALSRLLTPGLLALVFLAVVVWFAPVTKTLLNGQLNLILLWLVVEDLLGDVPKRWRGILTGIAAGIKLTPALFAVTMLVTGRRAWAGRAVTTFLATVAAGFALEPVGSFSYWRTLGGAADGYGDPTGYGNQSILYALTRTAGEAGLSPIDYRVFLPVALLLLAGALLVARRLHDRGHELATWGVTAVAMLAVTPVSWSHHWVWMLLPLAALVAVLPTRSGGKVLLAATVAVLCSGVVSLARHLELDGPLRLGTELLGNAYLLAGLALLVWFGRLAFAPSGARDPDTVDVRDSSDPVGA